MCTLYVLNNSSLNNNRQLLARKFVENVVTIIIDNEEFIFYHQQLKLAISQSHNGKLIIIYLIVFKVVCNTYFWEGAKS